MLVKHYIFIFTSQYILLPIFRQFGINLDSLVIYKKYDSVLFDVYLKLIEYFFQAILVLGWSGSMKKSSLNWYDIETDKWQCVLSMREGCRPSHLASIAEQFIFAVGSYKSKSHSVQMLDLSSQTPYWVRMPDMLVGRTHFRVCVLGNCVYVVSYTRLVILYFKWKILYYIKIYRLVVHQTVPRFLMSVLKNGEWFLVCLLRGLILVLEYSIILYTW